MTATVAPPTGGNLCRTVDTLTPFSRLNVGGAGKYVIPYRQNRSGSYGPLACIGLSGLYDGAALASFTELNSPDVGGVNPVNSHILRHVRINEKILLCPGPSQCPAPQLLLRCDRALARKTGMDLFPEIRGMIEYLADTSAKIAGSLAEHAHGFAGLPLELIAHITQVTEVLETARVVIALTRP
jgi:hypothetical protein